MGLAHLIMSLAHPECPKLFIIIIFISNMVIVGYGYSVALLQKKQKKQQKKTHFATFTALLHEICYSIVQSISDAKKPELRHFLI